MHDPQMRKKMKRGKGKGMGENRYTASLYLGYFAMTERKEGGNNIHFDYAIRQNIINPDFLVL